MRPGRNEVSRYRFGRSTTPLGLRTIRFELHDPRPQRPHQRGHRIGQPAPTSDPGLVVPPQLVRHRDEAPRDQLPHPGHQVHGLARGQPQWAILPDSRSARPTPSHPGPGGFTPLAAAATEPLERCASRLPKPCVRKRAGCTTKGRSTVTSPIRSCTHHRLRQQASMAALQPLPRTGLAATVWIRTGPLTCGLKAGDHRGPARQGANIVNGDAC